MGAIQPRVELDARNKSAPDVVFFVGLHFCAICGIICASIGWRVPSFLFSPPHISGGFLLQ